MQSVSISKGQPRPETAVLRAACGWCCSPVDRNRTRPLQSIAPRRDRGVPNLDSARRVIDLGMIEKNNGDARELRSVGKWGVEGGEGGEGGTLRLNQAFI